MIDHSLRWILRSSDYSPAEVKSLSLTAIRELFYRAQSIALFIGVMAGAIYNHFAGNSLALYIDLTLMVLLAINCRALLAHNKRYLEPVPLLVLCFFLLGLRIVLGLPQLIYLTLFFPAASYLLAEKRKPLWLNLGFCIVGSVLALYFLPRFEAVILIFCLFGISILLEIIFTMLAHRESELQRLALRDPLTDTYNRRAMEEALELAVSNLNRYQQKTSVIMIDIDRFKHINDTYGHGEGDTVLINLATFLSSRLRTSDAIFRYGGEEFILMLNNTSQDQAYQLAQTLRETIHTTPLFSKMPISVSCGVAEAHPGESIRDWLDRCDRALYKAKQDGRNRVELATLVSFAGSR